MTLVLIDYNSFFLGGHIGVVECQMFTLAGLQILSEKKVVLNPIKVMDEMSYHIPNFSLMIQQVHSCPFLFLFTFLGEKNYQFQNVLEYNLVLGFGQLQDASEALDLLINSLRKESFICYVLSRSPLAVPIDFNGRILSPDVASDQSEHERWQKHFLGPFDGITSSILSCQSCSSQVYVASI